MIRFMAVAALALAVGTSAHAMTAAPLDHPDTMVTKIRQACGAGRVRVNGVCWPEPPSAKPVDVRDGAEAFAMWH
jgi:hypothetical protein